MATTSDAEEKEIKALSKSITDISNTYTQLMNQVSYNASGSNGERAKEIESISNELDRVIKSEINSLSKFTDNDISEFLTTMLKDSTTPGNALYNKNGGKVRSIEELFHSDDSTMINYFINKQKENQNLFNEIELVSSQLYELQQAVNVTRDSIVTSDDISKSIARELSFTGISEMELKNSSAIKQIEALEKQYGLPKKIKNFIVPNTLKFGTYYSYTIPYSKLFEQYAEKKKTLEYGRVNEAFTVANLLKGKSSDVIQESAKVLTESCIDIVTKEQSDHRIKKPQESEIEMALETYLGNMEVFSDELPIPLLEVNSNDEMDALIDFRSKVKSSLKKHKTSKSGFQFSEGVSATNEKKEDFSFVGNDIYIKMIGPKELLPIEIMDTTIGYCYVHVEDGEVLQPFTNSIRLVDSSIFNREMEDTFISTLSDKVIQAFDKPFLMKNKKFKELILNSLMYNETYRKRVRFQFIPVDYVTKFTINEDEDGNGQSILKNSLFYAKLYLSILIFKVLQILTKSADTRVYYIRNSGLDADIMNGIQAAARQVKSKQINYYDVMNPLTSTSKIGNNNEIFIPYGRSTDKGMEFDVIAGQDIQLNTDLMEMLKQGYINSTEVPSVMMQYINEADYAKTLVMANSKYVGTVISDQLDLNPSITEWYQKIMKFSQNLNEDIIDSFEYKFIPPKTVNTQNLSELTSATDALVQYMINSEIGQNADVGDLGNKLKDRLIAKLSKYFLPTLPWDVLQELAKQERAAIQKEEIDSQNNGGDESSPTLPNFQ